MPPDGEHAAGAEISQLAELIQDLGIDRFKAIHANYIGGYTDVLHQGRTQISACNQQEGHPEDWDGQAADGVGDFPAIPIAN